MVSRSYDRRFLVGVARLALAAMVQRTPWSTICTLSSNRKLDSLLLPWMGLDPGMGVLHLDTKARDSLACDLMEPVRPEVDAFGLDWITNGMLKREWLFEQRDGNCRLMASFPDN
jgi:hypothetical protein